MKKNHDLVEITVVLQYETPKAWLVTDGIQKESIWIPKSQGEMELNTDNKSYTLTVPGWLAEEKGFTI
jgi:hypothetical protein